MLTPKQLADYTEYVHILEGIARRLIREGKAHIENGKLVIEDKERK